MSRASVRVGDRTVAEIGMGILLLVGVGHDDDEQAASTVADKVANLRIFADDDGKMNRSVLDVGGEVLVVSQFTLYADTRRGRRPSLVEAAAPELAEPIVRAVAEQLADLGLRVAAGEFGAHMEVELVNDGPVSILIET